MRVMAIGKATKETEAGVLPTAQELAEMGRFNEELVNAGILLAGEGLRASSEGVRIYYDGSKRTVVDGPFTETKELIAGFSIWQVKSMEEAVAWAKRAPVKNGQCELRRVAEAEDFGDAFTPELREQEDRLRNQLTSQ
jgi:hypothetical protein